VSFVVHFYPTAKDTKEKKMVETPALTRSLLQENPFEQFREWFEAAMAADIENANAMTLATATRDGRPSARMVLLKGYDGDGFVFFTNYGSQKGQELAENPQAALVFYWVQFHRQVRIYGRVNQVTAAESEEYFHSRPLGSQLSALASHQSEVVDNRQVLEERVAGLAGRYGERGVPRPELWGGYRLEPEEFEFWQGRADRLHDRFRYRREEGGWLVERLSP
jgi:pyridoxamine 5'-phosphate oxidase